MILKTRFIIGLILAVLITTVLCIGGVALSIAIYLFLAIAVFEVWQAFHHVGIDLSRSCLLYTSWHSGKRNLQTDENRRKPAYEAGKIWLLYIGQIKTDISMKKK